MNEIPKKGRLIVVSGPSGVGKTTICKTLCRELDTLHWSISVTTRPQRKGEKNGEDYIFVTQEEFQRAVQADEFIEYAQVHDHFYGTLQEKAEQILNSGNNYLMEIDVQGAAKVKQKYPQALFIFIAPPDIETLEKRLVHRAGDSSDVIRKRLQNAPGELNRATFYDYYVTNNDLARCIAQVREIIEKPAE